MKHETEIKRLLSSHDARDQAHVKQALRDAEACRESTSANDCTCFCCTLAHWVTVQRMVTVAYVEGFATPLGVAGFISNRYKVQVDLDQIESLLAVERSAS